MSDALPTKSSTRVGRVRRGRWLTGVCAGLAPVLRVHAAWVRATFVVLGLVGGLGVALYLACWLIFPAEEEDAETVRRGGVIALAQACAGAVALTALGLLGALATVFGFGWIVLAFAALLLAGWLVASRRLGPAWALLPIAAVTLPAVAVAAGSLRLAPRAGASRTAPRSAAQVRASVYRSGLDTLLIDLRRTALPAAGAVTMRIDAGVRRTIVALPISRCVHVRVRYDVQPFAAQFGALLTGHTTPVFSDLVLFGHVHDTGSPGTAASAGSQAGPVLTIDFDSQGGSLFVRDYPDAVNPDDEPNWPGFEVFPEPRPDVNGEPRRAARAMIRNWRLRLALERADESRIDALMPGPCETAREASR